MNLLPPSPLRLLPAGATSYRVGSVPQKVADFTRRTEKVRLGRKIRLRVGGEFLSTADAAEGVDGPAVLVGEPLRPGHLVVTPFPPQQPPPVRSSASTDTLLLTPPRVFRVEDALEYLDGDELVAVTPKSLRLRKRILSQTARRKVARTAARS